MIIGCDIDGVIADFTGHWPKVYEEWFGKTVPQEVVDRWSGLSEAFGTEEKFWHWVDRVPNFWRDMPLVPGAAGAIYQLVMQGHRVEFITNRHEKAVTQTDQWCRLHLPDFGRLWTVHHVRGDKSVVPCQLYIDDNPRRITELRKKRHRAIRFVQPWNTEVTDDDGMCAGDWAGVLDIVELLSAFGEVPGQRRVTDETTTISVGA